MTRFSWLVLALGLGFAIVRLATTGQERRGSRWKVRVFVAAVALFLVAYGRYKSQLRSPGPTATPAHVATMRTYDTKSGLLRVHYPDDFVANPAENVAVTFFEPGPAATVAKGTLVSVRADKNPISQDVNEYARVLQEAREKGNAELHYQLVSQGPGTCLGGNAGVLAVWTVDGFRATACTFVKNRIGYSFMSMVANAAEARDEPVVRRIIDGTELLDPGGTP